MTDNRPGYSDQPTLIQSIIRGTARVTISALIRVHVTGQANVPPNGPLIVVGNHLSTIDGLLLGAILPPSAWFVGPGDFRLLFPGNLFLKWSRTITVRRSTKLELASLKHMSELLRAGGILALFPEGGTWEKPIQDAKPGAAYLSLVTGAPILPVGLGGTYQVWNRAARLTRPRVTVNIGALMPPVQAEGKARREAALTAATQDIMQRIYNLLPPEDRARYDDWATRRYDVWVEVWRGGEAKMIDLPGRAALGELMQKPNLFSPFVRNAGLPLDPLRVPGVRFMPDAVRLAAASLERALRETFADYIEYRLGEAKAASLRTALAALVELATTPGVTGIALTPTSHPGLSGAL
jgi:1-acyl-sn-glycerol-3-phosphate acyltransferase